MHFKKKEVIALSLSILSSLTFSAYATSPTDSYVLVTPDCLLKNAAFSYQVLAEENQFTLLKTNDAGLEQLALEKHRQAFTNCGNFMNVTDTWENEESYKQNNAQDNESLLHSFIAPVPVTTPFATPLTIQYQSQVNQLLSQLTPTRTQAMWNSLLDLSNKFVDRYANSDTGVQTASWIKDQIGQMIGNRDDVSVRFITTNSYSQPSVLVKIGQTQKPGVVIGAHMDTLQAKNNKMPGADDDATGVITLLETARTLLSSNMHFKKPIYLVWYSAEEVGLVGSQRIVAMFKRQNIPVSGVMQFDMTGYDGPNNNLTMWLMNDFTDPELTSFTASLINTYVKRPIQYSTCGYACSDHATWTQNGYKAVMPAEATMKGTNPNIHSPQDTTNPLSLAHMTDYLKLAIAFAVEMSSPV